MCNGTVSWIVLLPIVVLNEYHQGTWRNLNVSSLIKSSFIQYLSSIASYSVSISNVDDRVDNVLGYLAVVLNLQHIQACGHHFSICRVFWKNAHRIKFVWNFYSFFGYSSFYSLMIVVYNEIGAILYNVNSKRSMRRRKSPELKPSRELSYMDLKTITI